MPAVTNVRGDTRSVTDPGDLDYYLRLGYQPARGNTPDEARRIASGVAAVEQVKATVRPEVTLYADGAPATAGTVLTRDIAQAARWRREGLVDLDPLGERLAWMLPGNSAFRARVTAPATRPGIMLQPVTAVGEGLLRADETGTGLRAGRSTRQWVSLHARATGLTAGSAVFTLGGAALPPVTVTSSTASAGAVVVVDLFPETVVSLTWTTTANTGAAIDVWLISTGWSA